MTSDETGLQPPDGNGSKPVDYNPNEFWLRTLLRWYIGLIIRPTPTIREIVERRPVWAGVVGLPASAIFWVGHLMAYDLSDRSISYLVLLVSASGILLAGILVILTLVMAASVHFTAKLAKFNGDFGGTYVGLALVAGALSWTAAAIGFTFFLVDNFVIYWKMIATDQTVSLWIALLAVVWIVALMTVVVRENYRIGPKHSALVTFGGLAAGLPAAILLAGPLIIVGVVLGVALSA